jgi:acylpyruvate hydrolase
MMKYATVRKGDGTHAARVEGDVLVELRFADVGEMLRSGAHLHDDAQPRTGVEQAVDSADLAPVVLEPGKIVCVGANYADHIAEMGREPPEFPTLFAKYTDALVGAREVIVMPVVSERVDWEAELTVVIGRDVRHANDQHAAAAIAGFTIANDISMRDWQNRTVEWLQGKTFEHSTPVGPFLVTPDELGGSAPDLEITCEVDGVRRQHSRTSDLVFGPAAIVAYISEIVTLRPGDLILTGTPGGVGHGMDPPVYLRSGQVVRTAIEGIGELRNECVREMP